MKKLIQFKNIVKEFDGQLVLKGINLDIYENEFVTLLGPSGCGKTTKTKWFGKPAVLFFKTDKILQGKSGAPHGYLRKRVCHFARAQWLRQNDIATHFGGIFVAGWRTGAVISLHSILSPSSAQQQPVSLKNPSIVAKNKMIWQTRGAIF